MEVPLDPWNRAYAYVLNGDSVPEILSYGADGKPGGELFDADISTSNLRRAIPESPREVRAQHLFLGVWIGAWICFIGPILVLRRTSLPAAN